MAGTRAAPGCGSWAMMAHGTASATPSRSPRAARASVRVSDDGAKSWREHTLPVALLDLEVLAVDPTQRDRVLAVVRRGGDDNEVAWSEELDTLMLSEDAGQNFRAYFDVAQLGAVAFGADGTQWIADAGAAVGAE